ncbi:MAG: hypothetical protein V9H25_23510 [Candidatus Competibacter sp.]
MPRTLIAGGVAHRGEIEGLGAAQVEREGEFGRPRRLRVEAANEGLNAVGHFGLGGAGQKVEALFRPDQHRRPHDTARVVDADDQARVAEGDLFVGFRLQQATFAGEAALDGDAGAEHHGVIQAAPDLFGVQSRLHVQFARQQIERVRVAFFDLDHFGLVFFAGLLRLDDAGVGHHQHRPDQSLVAGGGGGDARHDTIAPRRALVDQEADSGQADGEEDGDQEYQSNLGKQAVSHGWAPSVEWMEQA